MIKVDLVHLLLGMKQTSPLHHTTRCKLWASPTETYSSHGPDSAPIISMVWLSFGHCEVRGFTQCNHRLKGLHTQSSLFGVLVIKTTSVATKTSNHSTQRSRDLSSQPEVAYPLRYGQAQTTFSEKCFESFKTTPTALLTSYWV